MLGFYMNICEYEPIEIKELLRWWEPLLPPARIAYALRYRKQKDQLRCLAAGVLLHAALLEWGIPRDEMRKCMEKLIWGANTKPQFPGGFPHFNLSHSGDYVVCVVGKSPCGVDVQGQEKDVDFLQSFFSAGEWEWICRDKNKRAIRLWTMKESLGKCMGTGITELLPDVSPYLSEEECMNFALHDRKCDVVYRIQEWDFEAGYRVSVCMGDSRDALGCGRAKGNIVEKWHRFYVTLPHK